MKIAIIAGATGLIGKQVLELLLNDPEYHQVKAVTRSPLKITHAKLENLVIDFDNLSSAADQLKGDIVFCCLGTTMKKAGSKEEFRKVDYTYPVELARITRKSGAREFLLVSALGADKSSSIYYNQVKGDVEETVGKMGFPAYQIFRPSLLLGPREESRSGEDAAKIFYKALGFLIPAKWKAIDSSKVARAMLHYARQEQDGVQIHESRTLQGF